MNKLPPAPFRLSVFLKKSIISGLNVFCCPQLADPFSSDINPGDNETDSQETDVYNNISSLTTQTTSPHSLMLNK